MFPFSAEQLLPQEEKLAIGKKKGTLQIGIPKETCLQENRVGLSPQGVHLLVSNGHEVIVESGAGLGAKYSDTDYSEVGAQIVHSPKQVFEANLILKIEPPSMEELDYMKSHQTLFSALQLKTCTKEFFQKLMKKKITAISYEHMEDEDGMIPVVRCMSEIAGGASIQLAAEYLSNANDGKGYLFGGVTGVPPTEVVIIGAGTVGTYAAKNAQALGAYVKVFDNSLSRLKRMQDSLPNDVFTCIMSPKILEKALMRCDVAIGAMRAREGRTPCMVSEDMVSNMKNGSVIIDVSIDQGGVFETSEVTNHEHPYFVKHGVIHYGVPNLTSRVSRTASFSLSNIFAPMLEGISEEGGIENALRYKPGLRKGMYMANGVLTNKAIGEWFDLPYTEVNLHFGDL